MPKKLEKSLKSQTKKKGLTGKKADTYVYGTMRKTGWTPSTQKKTKGRKMYIGIKKGKKYAES